MVVFLWPRGSLDGKRVGLANLADLSRPVRLHTHSAWADVLWTVDTTQSQAADQVAFLYGDHDRGCLGID